MVLDGACHTSSASRLSFDQVSTGKIICQFFVVSFFLFFAFVNADRFDASCEIGALQGQRRRRRFDRRRTQSGTTAHDEPSEYEPFEPSSPQSRALSASPSCGHDECISARCRHQRRNAIEFKKPNEWRGSTSIIETENLEPRGHRCMQNTPTISTIATRCLDADQSISIGGGGGGSRGAYDAFTSGHAQSTSVWNRHNDDDERWRRRQWPSAPAEPHRRHEYDWRQYEWVSILVYGKGLRHIREIQ